MLYYYKWEIEKGYFGIGNFWKVREGTYLRDEMRGYRIIGEGFEWKREKALESVKRCIENDRYRYNNWRVDEGGQSPVSNIVTITPKLDLITPKMKRKAWDKEHGAN